MGHYKSNLRDIEFNLFEVLNRQDLLGSEYFPEIDEQTARGILAEVERLATGPVAESFAEADRNPPVFDPATSSVRMSYAHGFDPHCGTGSGRYAHFCQCSDQEGVVPRVRPGPHVAGEGAAVVWPRRALSRPHRLPGRQSRLQVATARAGRRRLRA